VRVGGGVPAEDFEYVATVVLLEIHVARLLRKAAAAAEAAAAEAAARVHLHKEA
jgi:hypothetical protein